MSPNRPDYRLSRRRPLAGPFSMMNNIAEARPFGDYRLYLPYADGVAGELDPAPLLQFTDVFEPLRDPQFCALPRVDPDSERSFGRRALISAPTCCVIP
jgi:hypothetical protein